MAEGSGVKRSGKVPRYGVNCNPFDLNRTPDSTCVTVWSIALKLDLFLHNKLAYKPRDVK